MRSTLFKAFVGAILAASLFVTLNPASAASTYHMNGQGTITIEAPGLPVCAGLAGNCAQEDKSFSWVKLTVQGFGRLANQDVSGTYSCDSEGVIGFEDPPFDTKPRIFQSRIYGNTSNFQLTFNFQCSRDNGSTGPAYINGWFSNVTGPLGNPAYHDVSNHPLTGPTGPAIPVFKGYFITANIQSVGHPYDINDSNGERMICNGGFLPSNTDFASHIRTAFFAGHCNAFE